ncbi:hypothetical protein CJ030_MR2G003641 [Morella rubra]|uniref:Uncharacterized protein n=1 Tax=Morella rubra TaxID=262757 RepID=A0A6A1WIC8_9ROSI|nr:hypothetical protein CJ030_MR2G003641 [Morella rubra]
MSRGHQRRHHDLPFRTSGRDEVESRCCMPPPWPRLFADLDSRVSVTVKATLQPVERQMQSLEEELKELWTSFDGECTVTMLRNKSVVAHMADVNEQLEEIKKTLDDFKMEANPQRILRDIPDDVATFCDAVRR